MIRAAFLTGRILTGLAAVLAVTALLAAFVPVRAELLVYSDSGEVVSCGSIFFPTENAGDDGCEDAILSRVGIAFWAPIGAMIIGGIGLAMVYDTYRKL